MADPTDFPIVCETCLGDNPYVRMAKAEFDKECKICARPFTVYRWKPGSNARYKKTEICQTCAKLKNVCQTCVLDLEFGLPVQVRDQAMAGGSMALSLTGGVSEVNNSYLTRQAEKEMDEGTFKYGRIEMQNSIAKLARNSPYYKRNQSHVCSFFLKGACNRGAACPYRHEIPETDPDLANQNIKDRYYGNNDPVAKKLLGRAEGQKVEAPSDSTIKTVYLGSVTDDITEQDIKDQFYQYGEITEVKMIRKSSTAYVTYATRENAEEAINKARNNCIIKDKKIRVAWAKPQSSEGSNNSAGGSEFSSISSNAAFASGYVPPNPSLAKPSYPSMNPSQFGSKRDR